MASTGSPKRKTPSSFNVFDDDTIATAAVNRGIPPTNPSIANRAAFAQNAHRTASVPSLRSMVAKHPLHLPPRAPLQNSATGQAAVDHLLSKLAQQNVHGAQARENRNDGDGSSPSSENAPRRTTPPITGASTFNVHTDKAELSRLKQELIDAQERIAQMDLELTQSRLAKHTVEQAIGSPFPTAQQLAFNITGAALPQTRDDFDLDDHSLAQGVSSAPWRMDTRAATAKASFGFNKAESSSNGFQLAHSFEPPLGLNRGYMPPISPLGPQAPTALPNGATSFQQPPIGTRLSPTAAEFPTPGTFGWSSSGMPQHQQAAFSGALEPLNYRRLLDRSVNCDWKFIVDKIIGSNDQQASIFLQQKLKIGTASQKYSIVQAIIDQAYPLMVNRFGNFLVQRCFEHGTPEQVVSIAHAIRGNTLVLSMDAFGCHVVQKAFDCVPEEYKAIMVHELLRRIPETVIHRYACHVWQKLFELRWSGSPPQIMKYVNEALKGMWHEVALGETGSLVVQNIFENCLEEDKRPCVDEVLSSIDVVAHGQFGNWCIQHICEHGTHSDRTRAIEHILRYATEYSMDQFASKVVEKCLKIGGNGFLDRYLDRVCEPRPDCPRMPLIDISGDQFGNYLIQYILANAEPQRREIVATHVRKHMVSLRGSKYGSRVAMLCCNPAVTIRPGPPAALPINRTNSSGGDRFVTDVTRSYPGDRTFVGLGRAGYSATLR